MAKNPDFVDISDVAALSDTLKTMTAPYTISFSQGGSDAVEVFVSVNTSRGAGMAELYFGDGRYVTVDVPTQLNGVIQ